MKKRIKRVLEATENLSSKMYDVFILQKLYKHGKMSLSNMNLKGDDKAYMAMVRLRTEKFVRRFDDGNYEITEKGILTLKQTK